MNLNCTNFNGLFDYIKESIPGVNFEKEDERYDIYNVFYKLDNTTVLLATLGKYLCAYNEAVIMCHSLKDPLIMSNLSDKKAILEYLESCILLLEKMTMSTQSVAGRQKKRPKLAKNSI